MRAPLVRAFFVLTLTAFVAACGNKGPLYLPGQPPPSSEKDSTRK
ncbi:MAG TPA: lipoprotein [Burkholderiales bacterium]|nr:lipoprotein [Burkholderiales bacterium]